MGGHICNPGHLHSAPCSLLPFCKETDCVASSEVVIAWFDRQSLEVAVLMPASWAQQLVFSFYYSRQRS